MLKTINEWQVIDHGVTGSQFFQGCGTAFTEFEEAHTGCGDTALGALNDAAEIFVIMVAKIV